MSAARLREAAEWIRKRAERAPEGPYGMTSQWTTPNTMLSRVTRKGQVIAEVREGSGYHGVYTVDYFSRWHPAVALAVADWLESEVVRAEFRERQQRETNEWLMDGVEPYRCYYDEQTQKAIDVADAYLGGAA